MIIYVKVLRSNSWERNKKYEDIYLIIDYNTKTIKHIVDGIDVKESNEFTMNGLSDFTVSKHGNTYNILKKI